MKRPFVLTSCALASCVAALFVHGRAVALPAATTFDAFLDEGPIFAPLGTLRFALSEEQMGMLGNGWVLMCRYLMEWRTDGRAPYAAYCSVDEPTWFGHTDCLANARSSFDGIVMRVPSSSCAGFDTSGAAHDIFQLVAGEGPGGLMGLIQFTAASARVSGFRALASP